MRAWLRSPIPALQYDVPLELLKTGWIGQIRAALELLPETPRSAFPGSVTRRDFESSALLGALKYRRTENYTIKALGIYLIIRGLIRACAKHPYARASG